MLRYNRVDIREVTDVAKSNNSKKCIICIKMFKLYWFFNHGFKFQGSIRNSCHDLRMLCLNISDVAIITVKGFDYRCIIRKFETIHLLENFMLKNSGYI